MPSLFYSFLLPFHKSLLFSSFPDLTVPFNAQAITLAVISNPTMSLASIPSTTLPPQVQDFNLVYHASSRARLLSSQQGRRIWVGLCVRLCLPHGAGARLMLEDAAVNMRYTVDQCLSSIPNKTTPSSTSPCNAPCATLSSSIQRNLQTPNASCPYDYCSDRTFIQEAQGCASCYRVIPDQMYISNCGSWLFPSFVDRIIL